MKKLLIIAMALFFNLPQIKAQEENGFKSYTINMYYSSSPYMIDFFRRAKESGNSSYGTHAGIVYYDGKQWKVTDNIHGTIHDRSLNSVLGGNGSIGITSMSDAGSL